VKALQELLMCYNKLKHPGRNTYKKGSIIGGKMDIFRSSSISLLLFAFIGPVFGVRNIPILSPTVQSVSISVHEGFPRTEPQSIEFASPSVTDINGDGKLEILIADGGGCVWAWDRNGNTLSGFPLKTTGSCDGPRINGPLAIGDIDGDGKPEIVAGTSGESNAPGGRGKVYAWNNNGTMISGWPKEMEWNTLHGDGQAEVYGVALGNVTGDSRLEVIAGTSNNAANGGTETEPTPNLYIWQGDGSILSGFPTGQSSGIFGFVGLANLSGDSYKEVIAPRDYRYLHAYNSSSELAGWPVVAYVDPNQPWQSPFLEFTRNAPAMGDLDGDGRVETVIAGKVRGSLSDGRPENNSGVLVLEPDGQRSPGWTIAKLGDRPPLAASYSPSQAPALADLDRDGKIEIVVALSDGTIRAYRMNGDLLWKYDYTGGRRLFASEPAIGDIDGDGELEIVFGTYSPDGSAGDAVSLLALNSKGYLVPGFPLKLSNETSSVKKGIRAAPTITDFDGDCNIEILAGSWSGTLYAWDLSAPYNADRIPWPTGRHDLQRTGSTSQVDGTNISVDFFTVGSHAIFLPAISTGCQLR